MPTRWCRVLVATTAAAFLVVGCAAGTRIEIVGGPAAQTAAQVSPAASTCQRFGSTVTRQDAFPQRYGYMVGSDIRLGRDDCHERIVIELQGPGELPGWQVRYLQGVPFLDPLGEPATMRGNAFLQITMNAWMPDPFAGVGYPGPRELFPAGFTAIAEVERTENFEGQSSWAVGLDRVRTFRVSVLADPPRIVVDVSLAATATATAPATTSVTLPAGR